jgi:hypothetical protein
MITYEKNITIVKSTTRERFCIHVAGSGNAAGGNNGGGKENREAKKASYGWTAATKKSRAPFLGSRWV